MVLSLGKPLTNNAMTTAYVNPMTLFPDAVEPEVEQLINYAVKEGYLDDSAVEWTPEQKRRYYDKCDAYEVN